MTHHVLVSKYEEKSCTISITSPGGSKVISDLISSNEWKKTVVGSTILAKLLPSNNNLPEGCRYRGGGLDDKQQDILRTATLLGNDSELSAFLIIMDILESNGYTTIGIMENNSILLRSRPKLPPR